MNMKVNANEPAGTVSKSTYDGQWIYILMNLRSRVRFSKRPFSLSDYQFFCKTYQFQFVWAPIVNYLLINSFEKHINFNFSKLWESIICLHTFLLFTSLLRSLIPMLGAEAVAIALVWEAIKSSLCFCCAPAYYFDDLEANIKSSKEEMRRLMELKEYVETKGNHRCNKCTKWQIGLRE